MNLRKLAEHQPCYLRLPEFCHEEQGNVMLSHIRRGGIGGTSYKPLDLAGVPCCFYCHNVYDGRTKQSLYTVEQLDKEMLRALVQWLDWLFKQEIVLICMEAA